MAYQSGTVGPLNYNQDNSGVKTDTTTDIQYLPQQFGAPDGAQIITGTVNQGYTVSRGTAYVENLVIQEGGITFQVYTQAADDGIFGHHSGAITVNTSFQWYAE